MGPAVTPVGRVVTPGGRVVTLHGRVVALGRRRVASAEPADVARKRVVALGRRARSRGRRAVTPPDGTLARGTHVVALPGRSRALFQDSEASRRGGAVRGLRITVSAASLTKIPPSGQLKIPSSWSNDEEGVRAKTGRIRDLDATPKGTVEEELIEHGTATAIREMRIREKSKKTIAPGTRANLGSCQAPRRRDTSAALSAGSHSLSRRDGGAPATPRTE